MRKEKLKAIEISLIKVEVCEQRPTSIDTQEMIRYFFNAKNMWLLSVMLTHRTWPEQ